MSQSCMRIRVEIESSIYSVRISQPTVETVQSICNLVISRHVEQTLQIGKGKVEELGGRGEVQIVSVEENGFLMNVKDTVKDAKILNGALLKLSVKGTDSSYQLESKSSFPMLDYRPGEKTSPLSKDNGSIYSIPLSSTFICVKVKEKMFKVRVQDPSTSTLRIICNDAVVRYMVEVLRIDVGKAKSMVESNTVTITQVEDGGLSLYVDQTMAENDLSANVLLHVTVDGLKGNKSGYQTEDNQYSSRDILMATDNYSKANLVGLGGQADVYKGYLFGTPVAVKRYTTADLKDMEMEIRVLQRVRHKNVISLIGYCLEDKCTISEFMEGGTLQDRLTDSEGIKFNPLTWKDRRRIVKETVSALFFLHGHNVLHRDLKPSNILFDNHGTVKVADMGLAKLTVGNVQASGIIGTRGYIDPNYLLTNRTSASLDIYSLGLVILQLCTNQPQIHRTHFCLSAIDHQVKRASICGLSVFRPLLAPADGTLTDAQVLDVLEIALQCVERSPKDRPSLESLLERLTEENESPMIEASSVELNSTNVASTPYSSCMPIGDSFEDVKSINGSQELSHELYQRPSLSSLLDALSEEFVESDVDTVAKRKEVETGSISPGLVRHGSDCLHFSDPSKGVVEKKVVTIAENRIESEIDSTIETEDLEPAASAFSWDMAISILPVPTEILALREEAEKGIAEAQFTLGNHYRLGELVWKNKEEALKWFFKAAKQGHEEAEKALDRLFVSVYFKVRDSWFNRKSSFRFIQKAATDGHIPAAQYYLGKCYYCGDGVEDDSAKAVQWWTMAAEQGHREAQFQLGECYRHGWGVRGDKGKAVEWYTRAARQMFNPAKEALMSIDQSDL